MTPAPRPRSILVPYWTYPLDPDSMFAAPRLLAEMVRELGADFDVSVLAYRDAPNDRVGARRVPVPTGRLESAFEQRIGPMLERRLGRPRVNSATRRRAATERHLGRSHLAADIVLFAALSDAPMLAEAFPGAHKVCWLVSFEPDEVAEYEPLLAGVDCLVVPSYAVVEAWASRSSAVRDVRCEVIHHWPGPIFREQATPARRAAARRRFGVADGATVVVYAGGMNRPKGVDVARRAMRLLAEHHEHLVLLAPGLAEGPSDPGAAPVVRCEGPLTVVETRRLPPQDLAEAYAAGDLGIVPSQGFDTFPVVPLEMMATGLVPVVSRVGGVPETVGPDHPYIVDGFASPEAWATVVGAALAETDRLADVRAALAERVAGLTAPRAISNWTGILAGAPRA